MKHSLIEPARLSWQDDTPISDQFDDYYFNSDGGLAETDYVYLQSNQLPERFAQFSGHHFTLAETGFGTGLSFLCARELWLKHSRANQQLHFISVEKYPLQREDLQQALAQHPVLAGGAEQLIEQYPPALAGFHRLVLDGGRVQLTLMLGEADDCLPLLDAQVDGWFLDGFSPAKNPDMWTATLFENIARCSHPGTTFSTFTSAGIVRRGLQAVGFEVRKVSGFGQKREMLVGQLNSTTPATDTAPWFQRPQQIPADAQITIIGAGLAGLCTAWSLAQRGRKVRVLERAPQPASNGSGNRQGALYAKPTLEATKQSRLHLCGMLYSQRWLHQIDPQRQLWDDCGVMLTAQSDKVSQRFKQIISAGHIPAELLQTLTPPQASAAAGIEIAQPALFYPNAGWVNPAALCQQLASHPLIELRCDWPVDQLHYNEDSSEWQLQGPRGCLSTGVVIVCCAADSLRFSQSAELPLKPIRGQVTHAPLPAELPVLKTVVCADGYISPPLDGKYCFGATFGLKDNDTALRDTDVQYNLTKLAVALPELATELATQPLTEGRVSWRCASTDYVPVVGELPQPDTFATQYAKLRQDACWQFDNQPPARYQRLFINVGHGSKGLITCPISGELLAAQICQEPLPVDKDVSNALDPCRFLVKKLIKQTL